MNIKKTALMCTATVLGVIMLTGCQTTIKEEDKMIVTSTGIVNGEIEKKYGKYGDQFNENGIPTYSLPFKIENAPEDTKSYAIVLEDKDAFPVSGGFSWIHWTAANITRTEIMENESQTATDFVQGLNSWTSTQGGNQSKELSSFYGGMAPPDAPHLYEIHVYALDIMLNLENGFLYNDMYKQMDGHILDQYTLKGTYSN
ncbi:YbhB/YbcL family Raf kinase inhibitor-like protein [uncultured Robinsoniella sp.]|uniref:YbhB/YbcL family Raf kinase inhibitor-like protein n=1 Tax=uncultured Robinsoniella sp. TaxID=904190 RepID=UPI00374FB42D